jgi:hypothetical protein
MGGFVYNLLLDINLGYIYSLVVNLSKKQILNSVNQYRYLKT